MLENKNATSPVPVSFCQKTGNWNRGCIHGNYKTVCLPVPEQLETRLNLKYLEMAIQMALGLKSANVAN